MAPRLRVVLGAAVVGAIIVSLLVKRRPKINLPGPKPTPLVGNLLEIIKNVDRRYEFFNDLFDQHGQNYKIIPPFFRRIQIIATIDPAVVEHVLRTNFENYVKGPALHMNFYPLLGDGIFSTDGEIWRFQRKTSSHIFTGKMFREVVEGVILEDLDRLMTYFGNMADTEAEFDFHAVLHTFTLDTFAKIGFGVDLQGLKNPEIKPKFAIAFDNLTQILRWRFTNPLWFIFEHFNGKRSQIKKDVALIDTFAYDCLEQKRLERDADSAKLRARKDLLDLFMDYSTEDGSKLTDKQLRDMILNMILAGRDTTAQALSWCFFELARHPDIVEKIREEVGSVLNGRIPGFDEVSKLKYTTAVFLESQRLYPSVPMNAKTAVKDDVLPGGIVIPAGTPIMWLNYGMGRSKHIWGADARDFKPDRWFDEDDNLKRESPFRFAAFNAGPRVCLGQQMATFEGVQVIAGLCRDFTFARVGGNEQPDPRPAVAVTLMMRDGLMMTARRRV